ncbi:hypothetical protein Q2328_24775, partial [Escherichia coli]|nr:hypothetical protein [Escherichia coli]
GAGLHFHHRFFFITQKTAYEMQRSLVGSEMCISDSKKNIANQGNDVGVTIPSSIPEGSIVFIN